MRSSEKGKSTRSTLFSHYVDDLCSIVCHRINMEKKKLSRNAVLKEKNGEEVKRQTLTIYVSVNVVASDTPSVMTSTYYSENADS